MIGLVWFFIITSAITYPFAIYGFFTFLENLDRMEKERQHLKKLHESEFASVVRRHNEKVEKKKKI